jgi:hypothetical protein
MTAQQIFCDSLRRGRIADFFEAREPIQNAIRFKTEMEEPTMNSIIYLIGLVVVVLAVLSFLGLS